MMKRKFVATCILACALLVGCGKDNTSEPATEVPEEPMVTENATLATDEYYMVISDVFTITGKGTIVTGKSMNAPLTVGTEVDIVSGTTRRETVITEIEDAGARAYVEELFPGSYAGITLEGFSRTDVNRGDLIVLRDGGKVGKRLIGEFELYYDANDPNLTKLTDLTGTTVDFSFIDLYESDTPFTATIESIELIEGIPAEGVIEDPIDKVVMTITLTHDITYIDNMETYFTLTVTDDAENAVPLEFNGIVYTAPEETAK